MPQVLPTIRVRRGDVVGNEIFVKFPPVDSYPKTFLSADEASGQTTLSVVDGTTLGGSQYALIEKPGTQEAEIIQISSSTATTVVVSSGTAYAHSRGAIVYGIPFDRVEISTDDNTGFSSPTTLTTEVFDIEQYEHYYNHTTGAATDYYRVRLNDSVGSLFSQYSDVLLATGYEANTVYMVKRRALRTVGQKIGDYSWLTNEWCYEVLEEGRRDLEAFLDHWSFRKNFSTDIGNVVAGQYIISPPSTLRESTTSKNLLNLYIGKNKFRLTRVDKDKILQGFVNTAYTTLNGAVTDSATSITLTNSLDFSDSGSVIVAFTPITATITGTIDPDGTTTVVGVGTLFSTELEIGDTLIVNSEYRRITEIASATSLTIAAAFTDGANDTSPDFYKMRYDTIDYDDNDRTNNTLRGVTNIHTGGHSTAAHVWQGINLGLPNEFTVTEDGIILNRPIDFDYHNRNIYADYWGTFTSIDSDADTFDEPDYDMFVNYLAFRIKKRKKKGALRMRDDDDGIKYTERAAKLINREMHEQGVSFSPDIAHLEGE